MALTTVEKRALLAAGLFAVALPALAIALTPEPEVEPVAAGPLLSPPPREMPEPFARSLFAAGEPSDPDAAPPTDAPKLVGIIGRIGTDAVAMVRGADDRTRTVAIGDRVDGWRLESLAIDAGLFTRGAEQARVPLPAGESSAPQ